MFVGVLWTDSVLVRRPQSLTDSWCPLPMPSSSPARVHHTWKSSDAWGHTKAARRRKHNHAGLLLDFRNNNSTFAPSTEWRGFNIAHGYRHSGQTEGWKLRRVIHGYNNKTRQRVLILSPDHLFSDNATAVLKAHGRERVLEHVARRADVQHTRGLIDHLSRFPFVLCGKMHRPVGSQSCVAGLPGPSDGTGHKVARIGGTLQCRAAYDAK